MGGYTRFFFSAGFEPLARRVSLPNGQGGFLGDFVFGARVACLTVIPLHEKCNPIDSPMASVNKAKLFFVELIIGRI